MTEIKIGNLRKAAALLAEVNMEDVYYSEVGIYFKDMTTKQIFDANICVVPENQKPRSQRWDESKYVRFIEESASNYLVGSRLSPDVIVSVFVLFKVSSGSESLYRIECTDLVKYDYFDRFVSYTPRTGVTYEVFFEEEGECTKASRGLVDAVNVVCCMGIDKLRPVESDLPWICIYGNGC